MDLIKDGVVENIKLDDRKIDSIQKDLKYLFYDIKEDLANDIDGGYRVELSFQEDKKSLNPCGPRSDPNQSILSQIIISNRNLAEMRRVMATKCTVSLGGTTWNIFKLIKLINTMKTKSQQYNN